MSQSDEIIERVKKLAKKNDSISIVWLYGSRAKNSSNSKSDYDFAVAFQTFIKENPLEERLRPELLALDWQKELGLHDGDISVVDINLVSIPLAFEIIKPNFILFCKDKIRLYQEEKRILSRMELDILYHRKIYGQ